MNTYFTHLDEIGYPHIRVQSDGRMFDELDGTEINTSKDSVTFNRHDGINHCTISKNRIYGMCFRAPWKQHIVYPYRCLDFLGFPTYFATWLGSIFSTTKYDYLKEDISPDGYKECVLVDVFGKLRYFKTHRLIALAFVPNPHNKETVNHIDGNKQNNCASNLEWMTRWENLKHAMTTGLKYSVLTEESVRNACLLLEQGYSIVDVAAKLSVPPSAVSSLLDGTHYRITRKYNIPYRKSGKDVPNEFKCEFNERLSQQ